MINDKLIQQAINSMGKTMWVCYSQKFARLVYDRLTSLNIKTLISISDDSDSDVNIDKFQDDNSIKCLVVVNRATLGFNMPELSNIVDLTGSRNLNRIFQLYSRITRVSKCGLSKRYFKVGFKNELELTKQVMNCALSLMGDNIKIYYGKNGKTLKYINTVVREPREPKDVKTSKKKQIKEEKLELSGLDILDVFTDIQFKLSNIYGVASKTDLVTVYETYGLWNGGNPNKNKELIKEFMRKYIKSPSQKSKDPEEKRLGKLLGSYISPSGDCFDSVFRQEIEELKKS